jgi:UDPglucose--hexose-1-phosphate uridylyltransferase
MIRFHKTIREAKLLPPPAFEPEIQPIEYRDDPLTGARAVINIRRVERPRQAEWDEDSSNFIRDTREGCFFCPENRDKSTPMMIQELSREGRILVNGSFLFPNRFPFAEYNAVATLSEEHFLDLDQFSNECLVDNLCACKEYVHIIYSKDNDARYPVWIWNYLPPSAGSMIHPHTQILVSREPTPYQKALFHESEAYYRENGRPFWDELIDIERDGERWIGENGTLALMASFAPTGNREVQFIFKDICGLMELDEKRTADFIRALVKVLQYYKDDGVNSFNLSTFSAGIGSTPNYYRLIVKMMSRPRFKPYYTAFGGPLELWHKESVVDTLPEQVASKAKRFFKG